MRCSWALLIVLLISITSSFVIGSKDILANSTTIDAITSEPAACGFAGNSDLYGIGIRTGYYTQALSVWIANYFVLSESKVLRSANLLFMLALFIGLVWLSHIPSQVYAVEAYLLSHLLIVTWSVGVFDKARFGRKFLRFSPAPVILQRVVLSGIVGYDLWFWWRGLDLMQKTPCGSFVFVIVKVNLYGWFRRLAKIASVIGAFGHVATSLGVLAQMIQYKYSRPFSGAAFDHQFLENLESERKTLGSHSQIPPNRSETWLQIQAERSDTSLESYKLSAAQYTLSEILELAVKTPLPGSPQQNEPSLRPSWIQDTGIAIPSFRELLNADAYLEEVLNIPTSNLQSRTLHISSTPMKLAVPSWSPQWCHLSSLRQRLPNRSITHHRPYRIWILITLFQHIYEHRTYPLYIYPKMAERALLSQHHRSVSYPALKTVMALRVIQEPDSAPPAAYLLPAVTRFLTIVVLMLSVECCIRWNSISGMGNFGAIGQLIPATIGIGGLVKVLWTWRTGKTFRSCEVDGIGEELRECAELYYDMKKREKQVKPSIGGEVMGV